MLLTCRKGNWAPSKDSYLQGQKMNNAPKSPDMPYIDQTPSPESTPPPGDAPPLPQRPVSTAKRPPYGPSLSSMNRFLVFIKKLNKYHNFPNFAQCHNSRAEVFFSEEN